ncbi:signal transduction histidine kinase [Microbacterium halimionae]|uniref:Signal transduction histidine kinase n=1 Tax=Microbacterium halimionae TaxID=1526413 RepID=A0A7W3PM44_9MICO|nr:GAF domain-containing sensor histidine kinase [Microbacterium halimionae]MBA8817200.1 signal transduction histidine kinase [Microbacterium halimionae]NII94650.1 signal transduction histidine kinase [Microbacterium halimionae]
MDADSLRLLAANHLVVEGLELDQVLRHIVDAAVSLIDAEYGALGVIAPDGHLERFIHVGISDEVAAKIGHLPEGRGILGAVIDSDAAIRLDDLGADSRSIGFPAHHPPMGAFLGVPIRTRNETYGNLYLTKRAGDSFTAEDEELVTGLAATAAIAIDNARLYEESVRAHRVSTALSEVTATLLAPDAGDAFGVVAERIAALVGADLVTIVVPGSSAAEYRIETARGVGAAAIEGSILPGNDWLVARAIAGGQVVSAENSADAPWLGDQFTDGSTVAVPFVVSGSPVGALCITRGSHSDAFSAIELATIAEFAAQAGLAVALAWARADRQRLDVIADRSRIARDLHDHVIQRLFGTGLGLQALAGSAPAHAAALDRHVAEIDTAIADIRTAIFALQNSAAESVRHRLLDVVTELTPSLRRPPRISFAGPVDLIASGALANDVVAVVREALANVARHAHADTAVVFVAATEKELTVTVDDDGVGVAASSVRASGTANMAARASAHGGAFVLEPRAGGGTRAIWQVPLASTAKEQR